MSNINFTFNVNENTHYHKPHNSKKQRRNEFHYKEQKNEFHYETTSSDDIIIPILKIIFYFFETK
jgi:hypothetical protein